MKKRLCVYCGSNLGNEPDYALAARQLARAMVSRNYGLVYGGASIGIMGTIANTVLEEGGEVIGIIPEGCLLKKSLIQVLPNYERLVPCMNGNP